MIPSDDPVLNFVPFDDDLPAGPGGAVVAADGHRDDDLDAAPPVSGQRDDVIVTEPSDSPGAPLGDPLEEKTTAGLTTCETDRSFYDVYVHGDWHTAFDADDVSTARQLGSRSTGSSRATPPETRTNRGRVEKMISTRSAGDVSVTGIRTDLRCRAYVSGTHRHCTYQCHPSPQPRSASSGLHRQRI